MGYTLYIEVGVPGLPQDCVEELLWEHEVTGKIYNLKNHY